jgi:hypothetical protein
VDPYSECFQEGTIFVGDLIREVGEKCRIYHGVLRKGPVVVDANDLAMVAEVELAGAAGHTHSAGECRVGCHALPDSKSRHAATDLHDLTHELMAQDDGQASGMVPSGFIPFIYVQVRATYGGGGDA